MLVPRPVDPNAQYRVKPHINNGYTYASTQPPYIDPDTGRKKYRYIHWGVVDDKQRFIPGSAYYLATPEERSKLIFPKEWLRLRIFSTKFKATEAYVVVKPFVVAKFMRGDLPPRSPPAFVSFCSPRDDKKENGSKNISIKPCKQTRNITLPGIFRIIMTNCHVQFCSEMIREIVTYCIRTARVADVLVSACCCISRLSQSNGNYVTKLIPVKELPTSQQSNVEPHPGTAWASKYYL